MAVASLGSDYRPMLQWVWDTDPTSEMLRRQLETIAEAAFTGVVIQPMPAQFRPHDFPQHMTIPYLGPAFFDAIRTAVEHAASLGLTVWIYDEGGWPSGSACGQVLKGHEHLRGKLMTREAGRCFLTPDDRPDPLQLEPTLRFIELTHEAYARAVGDHFGRTIRAVFTDELTIHGCVGTERVPWTDDLPQEFHRRHGYDLMPELPLLFEGSADSLADEQHVLRLRRDFSSLCTALFIERCLLPQRQWCERHGLQFVGHFAGDHDMTRHPHNVGDFLAAARQLHAPGVDAIWRQIWPDHRADCARFAGSLRLLQGCDAFSETGAVYGIDLAPAEWKWVCDQQIMRGINRFSLMSLRLSGIINQGLSPLDLESPTWPAMAAVNRHVGVLAGICSMGNAVINHAVLYPADDLHARGSDGPGLAAQGIMQRLQMAGIDAIYVDEPVLAHRSMLRLGVRDLYLSGGAVVTSSLVRHLRDLTNQGVRIHVVGKKPIQEIYRGDVTDWPPQASAIPSMGSELVIVTTPGPWSVTSRRGEGWDVTLVFNESDKDQSLRLSDASAAVYDVDEALVPRVPTHGEMTLRPGGVLALSRGPWPAAGQGVTQATNPPDKAIELRDWRVQPVMQIHIGPDERWRLQTLNQEAIPTELGSWAPLLGDDFSGQARYEASFHLDQPIQEACIDLGEVQYLANVRVDGQHWGTRAFAPYQVAWIGRLEAGEHRLEVCVSGTAANAFWAPAAVAKRRADRSENIYTQRIYERCPVRRGGGLLGPVRLWVSVA